MNPQINVSAFLTMIAACEGVPLDGSGYSVLFGWPLPGRTFTSFADHPRTLFAFKQTDGTVAYSSAAGRYQIIAKTYDYLCKKLGLTGFNPAVQDAMAMELIAEDGAMADVKAGRVQVAIDKTAKTWASLPASHYPQPRRTLAFALHAYCAAGGILANAEVVA